MTRLGRMERRRLGSRQASVSLRRWRTLSETPWGIEVRDLPATPDRILDLLAEKEEAEDS